MVIDECTIKSVFKLVVYTYRYRQRAFETYLAVHGQIVSIYAHPFAVVG